MQQGAHHPGTDAHDLAVLDAVAGLFEFILDDPGLSPRYRAAIAHLQIPALRDALVAPDFFSADQHPARQLIDLMGQFSRRFPEHDASHVPALEHIQAACAALHHDPGHPPPRPLRRRTPAWPPGWPTKRRAQIPGWLLTWRGWSTSNARNWAPC
ncbi:DUF1631 family protein [Thiobacillus denitrificans]|uniref:DUF1631 family protein n=1 Tax=Thiobacillus denitrificans TaxID=36861 RepID=UPI0022A96AF7|nr:DUF1631 family protein [Thiobacillus denitrificans]